MAFSDYTSPDSVRAALGISVKEVADTVVANTIYLTQMLEAMRAIGTDFAEDFLAAKAVSSRSTEEARFVLLAETFCAYTVALALLPSTPLAAPRVISDGKTTVERVDKPYDLLVQNLTASLAIIRTQLIGAYADINSAVSAPTAQRRRMVGSVGVAPDPITGV